MKKSDRGLSASMLAGSEEGFEFFCQPCSTENLHLEAFGFCQQCNEYMCDTCFRCHRKTAGTKHHQLLGKDEMPRVTIVSKPTDKLQKTCPTHPSKVFEYFCNSHGQLCCIVCLNNDHGSCRVVSHIPDVSDEIADSNEYKHLMTDIQTLASKLTNKREAIKRISTENDAYQTNALAAVRNFRQEADSLLNKFEENAVTKLSKLHYDNAEKVKAASAGCRSVLSELNGLKTDLDTKAKDGKANQLFVDIKLSKDRLSAIEASDVSECRISRYRFHQDEKIEELTSTLSSIWSISLRQEREETNAQFLGQTYVKTDDDISNCTLSGIAVLSKSRIVVTDIGNKAIKLVDTKLNNVSSSLQLSSSPLDVVTTGQNKVAVSLGNVKIIEIFTVTDTFSKSSTIQTTIGMAFSRFCFDGEKFIIISSNERVMSIMDMSGKVLRSVTLDSFLVPGYIALGRNKDVVYITDKDAHTLTTMTLSGQVISVYKHDSLITPVGVIVYIDNCVYVCSRDTRAVLQLSATGEFMRTLLDKENRLAEAPGVLAYDEENDRLHIGSCANDGAQCDYIRSYEFQS